MAKVPEALMTAWVGCALKSPYQNKSPAVSRQKQMGWRDPTTEQKQNNMASVPRLVTVIFPLITFLKST